MALPRRRSRTPVNRMSRDALLAVLLRHVGRVPGELAVGDFLTKDSGGASAGQTLRVWGPTLHEIIAATGSGLILWSELKNAILGFFERSPKFDPHLKDAKFSGVTSAECLASAIRRMLSLLRKWKQQPDRLGVFVKRIPLEC